MGQTKSRREVIPLEIVISKLKEVISSLSKIMPIDNAFLFGSYAEGNPKPYSDVDVVVISPAFGKNYIEETLFLMEAFHDTGLMVEPHIFTREEFKEAIEGTFLYNEVLQKGITLLAETSL
jgi:predicted nucleotidyltransferase